MHFKAKVSDLGFFEMDESNFSEAGFEELLKTKNLFEKKYVVVCRGLLGDKAALDFVTNSLEACANSENFFLFWEGELDEKVLEKAVKYAAKTQEFESLEGARLAKWYAEKKLPAKVAEAIKRECGPDLWRAMAEIEKYKLGGDAEFAAEFAAYNPFAICDAFGMRDMKKAWTLFRQAVMGGVPAEEVFYKVLWQVKNMLMVKKLSVAGAEDVAKKSGLHAFVASKAIKAAAKFSEEELEKYSGKMVEIYHRNRRGEVEMEIEFEKLLL